jgi:quercetin dioxygenase-like cupin family protein
MKQIELGYFGNIWVRQNILEKEGDSHLGHKHHFDHVTLLVKGKIKVEVKGNSEKEFTAPTFVVIRKELEHKITALTDDVLYYCIFALRNLDGDVAEIYGEEHNPLSASAKVN